MSSPLTPSQVEEIAKRAGLSMAQVCREAGIAASSWSRWKNGVSEPRLDSYRRILDVLRRNEAPRSEGAAA